MPEEQDWGETIDGSEDEGLPLDMLVLKGKTVRTTSTKMPTCIIVGTGGGFYVVFNKPRWSGFPRDKIQWNMQV